MSDIPPGKVPILASAGVAYRYLADNWMRWAPACVILGLLTGYLQMTQMQNALSAQSGGPPLSSSFLLANLLVLLFAIVYMAGLYKHAIRGEFTPPLGLSFGIDELRLLGVQVSLGLLFGILAFFFMFIGMIMVVAMAAGSGVDMEQAAADPEALAEVFQAAFSSGGGVILILIAMIVISLAVFAYVRLSLVQAATIGEQKMMIFSTWGWTKGNFWRVLAAILAVTIPLSLAAGIVVGIIQAVLLGSDPDVMLSAGVASWFISGAISGFLNGLIYVASAGLLAHLYKGLRADPAADKVFE